LPRFKGHGEPDAKDHAAMRLDARDRTLLKVEIGSNFDTDKTFVDLLGKDPSQHYIFIMKRSPLTIMEELDM
jgi:DNA gyrase/topoisomerase IV subunit B